MGDCCAPMPDDGPWSVDLAYEQIGVPYASRHDNRLGWRHVCTTESATDGNYPMSPDAPGSSIQELVSDNLRLTQKNAEQDREVAASQRATLFALVKLTEARDVDTGRHIERVQVFARVLAESMLKLGLYVAQVTSAFIDTLFETASLHDIGKVAIPDAILLKPGKLTAAEFTTMQRHSAYGAETLAAVLHRYPDNQFLRMGVDVARSHHEKWDGSGYPDGLAGAAIPLAARIVAIADYYDALTSKRCYRSALSHEIASQMIHENCGTHFDPDVVLAFGSLGEQFEEIRSELRDA